MRIIESTAEMQQQADAWRRQGKRIGLVPTMGFFHQGHLALMRRAVELADVTVVSIFVNPTQFGPEEDFKDYPRDLERDLRLIDDVGVDAVLVPGVEEMYPEGFQTYVQVTEVTRPLCGRSRPVFLRGVATVVTKLFMIAKPHMAVFGEKDFQQLVTVRRMVRDLNMDIEIIGHPIVREPDGLAMSSRNTYLDSGQRQEALRLSRSLNEARALVAGGERDVEVIHQAVVQTLDANEALRIDYVEFRHPETLEQATAIEGPTLLALAAHVGKARLIDNTVLQPAE